MSDAQQVPAKAFDFAPLLEDLKKKGLSLTELAARDVLDSVFSWVDTSLKQEASPWASIVGIVLPELKKTILGQVDKIDGQVQG